MRKNKDLYNQNKKHNQMEIKIPPNLNHKESKCFNEIVKPQLEELYSYSYDNFEFEGVKIFIAKDKFPDNTKRPNTEEIKNILNKIPKKDLKFVSDIYFVSYHCKDDSHKEFKGRTLPIIHKIIIYPKTYNKLKIVLAHEIGHIVFEKKLTEESKQIFALVLLQTFPSARFGSVEEYKLFINEQFADSYEIYINNPKRLKEFPLIYNFFKDSYNQSSSEGPTPNSSSKQH